MASQFESWFKTILGAKLSATATSMTVATIPTVTAGRLYLNNWAQEERISFTWRSGNTITWLTRGLSKTAVPSTAWTWLSWIAWTPVILVEMHDQMISATQDNTFSGNNTFSWTNTFTGTVNMWALWDLNVLWQSNPCAVVANTAARDVLYPSPVTNDEVYVQSLNARQIYNGWTTSWETQQAGTTVVDATSMVKWVTQLYKTPETTDLGSTWAAMTPLVSDLRWTLDNTYMVWEAITAGQCVFVESWPATWVATNKQDICKAAADTRVSFPVIGTWVGWTAFKVNICKTGSPAANLNFRIETDNAWAPSGTLVDANATATVPAASLTTSLADTTITLWWTITLTLWTKYHVVAFQWTYGSETVSNTNYYNIGYSTNHTSTRPTFKYNWSVWDWGTTTIFCYLSSTMFTDKLLSLTDADYSYKVDLYWISTESKWIWEYLRVTMKWINANQSGLVFGSTYFLTWTPWAISTTAWTNRVSIWRAIWTTKINMYELLSGTYVNISSLNITYNSTWAWTSTPVYMAIWWFGRCTHYWYEWEIDISYDNSTWVEIFSGSGSYAQERVYVPIPSWVRVRARLQNNQSWWSWACMIWMFYVKWF